MKVVYCDNCGISITSEALSAGETDGKPYCAKCAPLFKFSTSALQAVQSPGSSPVDQTTVVGLPALLDAAPAPSVTKFYFCETCGKRITDKQILEGLGRDKKLKGVYCKDCAVGVMTMEMDAINIEELSKAAPKSHTTPQSSQAPRRGSGIIRSPDIPSKHIHSSESRGDKKDGFPVLPIFGGAAVVAILVAFALLRHPQRTIPPGEPSAAAAPIQPKQADTNITAPPQVQSNMISPPQTQAAIPEFHSKVPDTGLIGETTKFEPMDKTEPAAVQSTTPAVAEPTVATIPIDDKPLPPIRNESGGKSRELFAGVLKELTPLLKQNQFSEAEKLLDEKSGDGALSSIADQLKKEKADLLEIRALHQRAMEVLRAKNGLTMTLKFHGAKMSGVIKVDPNHSDISLVLKDGLEMSIKTELLDTFDIDSLIPMDPVQAEEFRQRGILFLAANEWGKAESYFSKARDLGMQDATAIYFERIAAARAEAKEAVSAESWKKAEVLFANRNWAAAKQAYEAFQHESADSTAFATNKESLKARLQAIEEALGPARAVSLDLGGGVKLELVLIPSGEFEMGSKDVTNEKPVHKVKISRPFYMGKYVVTQAQYMKVAGKNPSRVKGDTFPVEMINFIEAQEFCKKVSGLTGKTVRLPTEAEWEYACRAGTKTKYSAGDNESLLDQEGWYNKNSEGKMHPVGQKKPNAWGAV